MENITDQVGSLVDETKKFAQTSIELYKLKAIDKSADIISTLAAQMAIVLFAILFVLMVNIGISLWVGELVGKTYLGFLIVSGFYAIGACVFYAMRNRWIKSSVHNSIIEQALS